MSYQQQLKEHYKAVRERLEKNAIEKRKPLMLAAPKPVEPIEVEPPKTGLVVPGEEGRLVSEALKQINPCWIGANHTQALKIAKEMASSPRLPPLPGLVLNEIGAVRWMRVLHAVAAYHKVDAAEILSTSRKRHVANARFEVFYRLRVDLSMSYKKIASLMNKDHTTVLHGVNKMRAMILDGNLEKTEYDSPPFVTHLTHGGTHSSQS